MVYFLLTACRFYSRLRSRDATNLTGFCCQDTVCIRREISQYMTPKVEGCHRISHYILAHFKIHPSV